MPPFRPCSIYSTQAAHILFSVRDQWCARCRHYNDQWPSNGTRLAPLHAALNGFQSLWIPVTKPGKIAFSFRIGGYMCHSPKAPLFARGLHTTQMLNIAALSGDSFWRRHPNPMHLPFRRISSQHCHIHIRSCIRRATAKSERFACREQKSMGIIGYIQIIAFDNFAEVYHQFTWWKY